MPHPFESHGLGREPFKLVGCQRCEPMARCEFCGKAIRYRFECEGADGRTFGVGRDCVNKVEASGSVLRADVERAAKEQEQLALNDRVRRVKDALAANPDILRDVPHPTRPGETLRDYVEFVLANGGPRKLTTVCKIVEDRSA